jgi:DNA mismatch endonuclease, patch repair protein
MAAIRGRNNKTTEAMLVSLLRRNQIWGWRRHLPIPGRPDFTFTAQRLTIFIDGCFWHGCPKHSGHVSKSGVFWTEKIQNNRARDVRVTRELKSRGWRVLRVWEHQLRDGHKIIARIRSLLSVPKGQYPMIKTSLRGRTRRRLLKTVSMKLHAVRKSSLPQ